jgi:hypothetical protein
MHAWQAAVLPRIRLRCWLLVTSTALLSACGGGAANGPPLAPIVGPAQATSLPTAGSTPSPGPNTIGLSQSSLSLQPGANASVSALPSPSAVVSVSSSNSGIATVTSSSGVYSIHAITPGTTTITFSAPGYATAVLQVRVYNPITLNPSTLSLSGSASTANVLASETGYSGTFSVSANTAPGVATISQTTPGNFLVTALSTGSTSITIRDANGQQAILPVNVSIALTLSPSSLAFTSLGTTKTFTSTEPGYSGAYTIVSNSTPTTASITQTSRGIFAVTSVGSGTTHIVISDSAGLQQTLNVGVTVSHVTVSGIQRL